MKARRDNVQKLTPEWRTAFQSSAMKSSFCLALSQPMLEFLCATADGVQWDRRLYYRQWGAARPDNTIAASRALEKRGLIIHVPGRLPTDAEIEAASVTYWKLTPAGEALVALLKVAGIFVEADAAIVKRLGSTRAR